MSFHSCLIKLENSSDVNTVRCWKNNRFNLVFKVLCVSCAVSERMCISWIGGDPFFDCIRTKRQFLIQIIKFHRNVFKWNGEWQKWDKNYHKNVFLISLIWFWLHSNMVMFIQQLLLLFLARTARAWTIFIEYIETFFSCILNSGFYILFSFCLACRL